MAGWLAGWLADSYASESRLRYCYISLEMEIPGGPDFDSGFYAPLLPTYMISSFDICICPLSLLPLTCALSG